MDVVETTVPRIATPTGTKIGTKIARFLCLGLLGLVLAALVVATIEQEFRGLLTSGPAVPYPQSIYTSMAVPGTSPVPGAPGAAGADFSQVYTSAMALRHGESAYHPTSPQFADRFGRLPNYPPLMNWISVPLTLLPYYVALLVHTGLSLLTLFGATAFVLVRMGLKRHVWPVIFVQASLYFLTPIGFTHFERGQFDLLVATSLLLCFACVFARRSPFGLAAMSGFLGALKWTAIPFLGCFAVLGFLLGSRSKRWGFVVMLAVVALATGPFWRGIQEYWVSLRFYEVDSTAEGLTLQIFLPRIWTKLAPILATASVVIFALPRFPTVDRSRILSAISAPFALALTNLSVCFGAMSYEYHTVVTLGMVPALVVWLETDSAVPAHTKAVTSAAFGLFLIVAFRLFGLTALSSVTVTWIYLDLALFFLLVCGYTIYTARFPVVSANPSRKSSPESARTNSLGKWV
jgi:hypothetical protein